MLKSAVATESKATASASAIAARVVSTRCQFSGSRLRSVSATTIRPVGSPHQLRFAVFLTEFGAFLTGSRGVRGRREPK